MTVTGDATLEPLSDDGKLYAWVDIKDQELLYNLLSLFAEKS